MAISGKPLDLINFKNPTDTLEAVNDGKSNWY